MRRVFEYERRTKTAWSHHLGVHIAELSDLIERGVLRPHQDGTFSANYVGTVMSRDDLLAFCPEYVRDLPGETNEHMQSVAQSMLRYVQRRQRQTAVATEDVHELVYTDESFIRRYERFSTLWRDYGRRGLYARTSREHRRQEFRGIHWPKTVAQTPAIHASGSVLYPSPIASIQMKQRNLVTQIHAATLLRLLGQFEPEYSDHYRAELELAGAESAAEMDSLWALAAVERERGGVFRYDDSRVLALLLDELLEEQSRSGPVAMNFIGTTAFHCLWEDACAATLGDLDDLRSDIAQPVWTLADGTVVADAAGRHHQRPDIISLRNDCVAILDAKYYYPYPESRCGWQDLAKQFVYAHSYLNPRGHRVLNALLFPYVSDAEVSLLGQVVLTHGAGNDLVFPPIFVFGVSPIEVFRAYVRRTECTHWLDEMIAMALGE